MKTTQLPSLSRTMSVKLIRWMCVLGMLCALFLAAFSYQSRISEFEARSRYNAGIIANYINEYMQGAYAALQNTMDEPDGTLPHTMTMLKRLYPQFTRVMLVDGSRKITTSVPPALPGQELAVPLLPVAVAGGVISQPQGMTDAGDMGVYLGVKQQDGSMLVAELHLRAVQKHLAELFPKESSLLVLTDAWGNTMVHPDWAMVRRFANIGLQPVFHATRDTGSFFGKTESEGRLLQVSAMRIASTGWVILHIMPTMNVITGTARDILAFVAVFAALYTVLAASLLYELQRGLARPLREFTRTIKDISVGAWPGRSGSPETYDEFQEMRLEFDNMSAALEEREADLTRAHLFVQNIIDAMPSVVVALDTQGHVTHMNRRAAERMQHNAPAGKTLLPIEAIAPQISPFLPQLHHALHTRTPLELHLTGKDADGSTVHEEVQLAPLPGESEGGVLRIDDVTQRIQLEEMMIQTEKMMSVGGLAAGMAHEINNPLGAILQGTQNIRRRITDTLPANIAAAQKAGCSMQAVQAYMHERKIPDFLQGIQESGQRAANIVSNMLTFSRRSDASPTTANLHAALDRTVQLASSDYDLKKKYDFRQVHIVREFADDVGDIICHPIELEQVVLNLLRNAAQSVATQGAALKETGAEEYRPTIHLRTRREDDWAVIEIEDNGTGMSAATRRRIFEPFFTTKQAGQGTGLGLSVSYFIITKNHGGTLTVDSQEGEGTTFTIRIPVNGPAAVRTQDSFT